MRTTNTPLDAAVLVGPVAVTGSFPRALCWIRGGSDNRREFRRALSRHSLGLESPDGAQDYGHITAFVVYGFPDGMRAFLASGAGFLASWEYVMDARLPGRAAGSGMPKEASSGKPPKAKPPLAQNPGGFTWSSDS